MRLRLDMDIGKTQYFSCETYSLRTWYKCIQKNLL